MVFCRREPLFFMKVDIPVLHTAYAYDRAGNRTSVQAGDRRESYHYDRGRLTTRTVEHTQDPEGKTYTYRYDAQGNTLGDGENTYLYDCLNRIAEVQTKAGDIQKNHYDAEGLRSQMEENGKLVSFVYADREVITEEDEAGAHIRYIRGHELLASDSAHARTYYHYACDEMGSITDITDCDGTVLNHYAYDAFGNRTVEEETVENRFGFAGEILDAVTGQYYLRARFYNPVIARFLSEDTYYGDGLNLYAYCHNNPVGYVDPSGHASKVISSSDPNVMDIISRTTDGRIPGKEDFPQWFEGLSKQDVTTLYSDKKVKNAIQNRLRNGGGKHEWLAVSKAPVWKDWCSVYDVLNGTTNTKSINFLNIKKADGTIASGPHGCTSKGVSDAAHKELFNIIESSKDFEDYKAKLNKWADNHLELVDSDGNVIKKGAEALPSNLRKKPARIAPCGKKYY